MPKVKVLIYSVRLFYSYIIYRQRIEALPADDAPRDSTDIKLFIRECRQWQADLLFEIYRNNWRTGSANDMHRFSTHLDDSVRQEREARFCRMMLRRLDFTELPDREQQICRAHRKTFDWLFLKSNESEKPWANFVNWLENTQGNNIYWITGKAGSGKSTLMKFLYHDPRTIKHVKRWVGNSRLLIAGFFFWNSGSVMQMSRMGLLQTLLYQLLQDYPELIIKLFQRRWELYNFRGEGLQPWTWTELRKAFEILISNKSFRFFFVIDGLDEFDGDHTELINLIIAAGKFTNVKICTASRPWLVFEDAFDDKPSLRLEDLSARDIMRYITSKFDENKRYVQLQKSQPDYAQELVNRLAQKASGVFLWVYLIVNSLLQGLLNSDRISDLQRRLDAIPSDLEDVFDRMLGSLDPFYYKHACQLIQIVEAAEGRLNLLDLYFADEEDPMVALIAKVEPLCDEANKEKVEEMRRRLISRCKGLLEVKSGYYLSRIRYLHRTVKDFLRRPDVWSKIIAATDDNFNPAKCLSHGFLLRLKTADPSQVKPHDFWTIITSCIYFVERYHDGPQVAYFDELDRAAVALTTLKRSDGRSWIQDYTLPSQPRYWTSTGEGWTGTGEGCLTIGSFLLYAICHNASALESYACYKIREMAPLDNATRKALINIAEVYGKRGQIMRTIMACSTTAAPLPTRIRVKVRRLRSWISRWRRLG